MSRGNTTGSAIKCFFNRIIEEYSVNDVQNVPFQLDLEFTPKNEWGGGGGGEGMPGC